MIIVEGPDGSGKSTLIRELTELFELPVAPRAVSSRGEIILDLREYILSNLRQGFRRMLYDRFALISGPIYGSVHGMSSPNEVFQDPDFQPYAESLMIHVQPIIIYCLPSLEVVKSHLDSDSESVVGRHLETIYYQYQARYARDSAIGLAMRYDWTGPRQQLSVFRGRLEQRLGREEMGFLL